MQAIKKVCLQEHRDGDAAALDKNAVAVARPQRPNELVNIDAVGRSRNAEDPRRADPHFARPQQFGRAHVQRLGVVVVEHPMVLAQTPAGIEHDPYRIRPRHQPRRQLRIVDRHRSRSNDDRMRQRTEAVHMEDVFRAGDPLRFTGVGGDETVEALAQMTERQRPRGGSAAEGEIQIEQRPLRIVKRQQAMPP